MAPQHRSSRANQHHDERPQFKILTVPTAETEAPQAKKPTGEAAKKLIDRAYKAWQRADEAERERRIQFKKNTRMLTMQQWEDKDRQSRESQGRPIITDDRLTPAVQAIVNSERENRPSAKIHPINAAADEDTAQVIEGGIRHIEYLSQAAMAYDTAFESAVGRGWGFWRVKTDYCDDGSFDNQEIQIEELANTLSVYPDDAACKPDLSDMMNCCILTPLTHERYKQKYGGEDPIVVRDFQADGSVAEQWIDQDQVMLCEYWEVTPVPKTKILVERAHVEQNPDGTIGAQMLHVVFDDKDEYEADHSKKGDQIIKEREWTDRKVDQYILTADECKEHREWAGKWIPIIRCIGKAIYDENGKLKLVSAIEHAIPNQQLLNVAKSFQGESITLAGRPKWMGALGSFKTKANDFANHNRSNITYLEYDPVEISPGVLAPPPVWETFNPNIEWCLASEQAAIQSIQSSTMVFDPELGHNSSPDQSGAAINALQKKGQQGNFHFFDNLTRAQWHSYRIIIQLFPKIYDTAREIGWLGPDQARSVIKVNQPYQDEETGKTKTHMLDAGRYGVIVSPGPSYDSQRLEAESFVESAMGTPVFVEKCPDLLVKLKDLGPIGDEIAKRVAPPGYGDQDQDDPIKLKQGLAQLTQQSQQMTQVIHQLMQEKEANMVKANADFRKAEMQEKHADYRAITVAEISAKTQLGLQEGKQAQDALAQQLGFAHEVGMAHVDHTHDVLQAAQGASHDAQLSEQSADQAQQAQAAEPAQAPAAAQ